MFDLNPLNIVNDYINEWLNAERQERIVSFQIFLVCILTLFIIIAWQTNKIQIYKLKDFIEQGQRNLASPRDTPPQTPVDDRKTK